MTKIKTIVLNKRFFWIQASKGVAATALAKLNPGSIKKGKRK